MKKIYLRDGVYYSEKHDEIIVMSSVDNCMYKRPKFIPYLYLQNLSWIYLIKKDFKWIGAYQVKRKLENLMLILFCIVILVICYGLAAYSKYLELQFYKWLGWI